MPIIKWLGGKSSMLPQIRNALPPEIGEMDYFEPFVGGAAVAFDTVPKLTNTKHRVIISDINIELMNMYDVIKKNPNELINELRKHPNTASHFYEVRQWDRDSTFFQLDRVMRAGRFMYLNKTCFHGLHRENSAGNFNASFGFYRNPTICDSQAITDASEFFNKYKVEIACGDYENILFSSILEPKNSFVYLDPPYDGCFSNYVANGWDDIEQKRLKKTCDYLDKLGCKFLLSNSKTDLILGLYTNYRIQTVTSVRKINNSSTKGLTEELLIRNY